MAGDFHNCLLEKSCNFVQVGQKFMLFMSGDSKNDIHHFFRCRTVILRCSKTEGKTGKLEKTI